LRAVADDGDLLALDEVDVGITIVIDAHRSCSPKRGTRRAVPLK
jgi:hypothetical protein